MRSLKLKLLDWRPLCPMELVGGGKYMVGKDDGGCYDGKKG